MRILRITVSILFFSTVIQAQEECTLIKDIEDRVKCYDSYFVKDIIEESMPLPIEIATEETKARDQSSKAEVVLKPNQQLTNSSTPQKQTSKKNYIETRVVKIISNPYGRHTIYTENINFKLLDPVARSIKISGGTPIKVYKGLFGYQAEINNLNKKYSIKILN